MRALASRVDGPVGNVGGAGDTARGDLRRVHRFPHPVHMSYGPVTLGKQADIPVFPSPYYY